MCLVCSQCGGVANARGSFRCLSFHLLFFVSFSPTHSLSYPPTPFSPSISPLLCPKAEQPPLPDTTGPTLSHLLAQMATHTHTHIYITAHVLHARALFCIYITHTLTWGMLLDKRIKTTIVSSPHLNIALLWTPEHHTHPDSLGM